MDILTYIRERTLLLDGAMGSLLLARGLRSGERSEQWCLTHPQEVESIHRSYFDAGSNAVLTNTFGANRLHHDADELRAIVFSAVTLARRAAEASGAPQEKFVALDIGPCGQLVAPSGELSCEEASALYGEVAALGAQAGADCVFIETMYDLAETCAALCGVKAACALPVFVSNTYRDDGVLFTGAAPGEVIATLADLGADMLGLNCSMGPERTADALVAEYLRRSPVPVSFKPNAGQPEFVDGKAIYKTTPAEFAARGAEMAGKGVKAVGGCCGTTPAHIAALAKTVI